jgi:hypothetical protein
MARRAQRRFRRKANGGESRAAEVLTVGWMLCVFTATACEVGYALVRLVLSALWPAETWEVLLVLLLIACTLVGFLVLMLTPAVLRARRQPPPRAITVFALVVGAAPLVLLLPQYVVWAAR